MLKFFEGNLFANICSAFSAIGTVGAVIISLYLIFRENKVKYKVKTNTVTIMNPANDKYIQGYGINIVNLSYNKNLMLNQSIVVKCPKNKELVLLVDLKLPKEFITPKILSPGEDFTFFIEKEQIEEILKRIKSKKIIIYFRDKANIKYKTKIKRKELEEYFSKI